MSIQKTRYSVYVTLKSGQSYMYVGVTRYRQKGGLLYIHIGKTEKHLHEMIRTLSVQVRKYVIPSTPRNHYV